MGCFELDLDTLLGEVPDAIAYEDVITFPAVKQDLAFSVDESVAAGDLIAAAREAAGPELRDLRVFDVYRGDQVGEGKKSIALAAAFQSPERTLSDADAATMDHENRRRACRAVRRRASRLSSCSAKQAVVLLESRTRLRANRVAFVSARACGAPRRAQKKRYARLTGTKFRRLLVLLLALATLTVSGAAGATAGDGGDNGGDDAVVTKGSSKGDKGDTSEKAKKDADADEDADDESATASTSRKTNAHASVKAKADDGAKAEAKAEAEAKQKADHAAKTAAKTEQQAAQRADHAAKAAAKASAKANAKVDVKVKATAKTEGKGRSDEAHHHVIICHRTGSASTPTWSSTSHSRPGRRRTAPQPGRIPRSTGARTSSSRIPLPARARRTGSRRRRAVARRRPPPPPHETDVCPNIAGLQVTVPAGMVKDSHGNCVPAPTPGHETDACPNIAGVQVTVPAGFVLDAHGNCVPAPTHETDVCPNIAGVQVTVPAGFVLDAHGNCVPAPTHRRMCVRTSLVCR